jgi:hypothetical protein
MSLVRLFDRSAPMPAGALSVPVLLRLTDAEEAFDVD